ncbi:MAG: HGGxSTG domain-containing protein [Pseudomonadota bacterium]
MQHPAPVSAQPAILAAAPRCGARTRAGHLCRSPAVGGRHRCRMHGGKGSGAPRGNRNAWKHGGRSAWIRSVARYLRATSPCATGRQFAGVAAGGNGADSRAHAGPIAAPAQPSSWRPTLRAGSGLREKSKKTAIQPHAPGKSGLSGAMIVASRGDRRVLSPPGIAASAGSAARGTSRWRPANPLEQKKTWRAPKHP